MFLFFTSLRRQTNTDKLTATVAILRLFPNFIKEPFASLEEGILNSNDPAGGLVAVHSGKEAVLPDGAVVSFKLGATVQDGQFGPHSVAAICSRQK
ncbi:uncharacterized protein AB9W97_005843 isoform 2-T2 [Spinachia spinachia]